MENVSPLKFMCKECGNEDRLLSFNDIFLTEKKCRNCNPDLEKLFLKSDKVLKKIKEVNLTLNKKEIFIKEKICMSKSIECKTTGINCDKCDVGIHKINNRKIII